MSSFIWITDTDGGLVLANVNLMPGVAKSGDNDQWSIIIAGCKVDITDAEARRVTDLLIARNPEDGPWWEGDE